MNKKNRQLCSALVLALGITTANAALNTPLGKGALDGSANKVAKISLSPIMGQSFTYTVKCEITDANGTRFPTVIAYGVYGLQMASAKPAYTFDSMQTYINQVKIVDTNVHMMEASYVNSNDIQPDTYLELSWVASDDTSSPTRYTCYATPTLGRKQ